MLSTANIAGIVLAAGQSSRMGKDNKLLMDWRGQPMASSVVSTALESDLKEVIVVTGHEADQVKIAMPDAAKVLHNPKYKSGMASSLKAGLEKCASYDGILILLGDMPLVNTAHINSMLDVFSKDGAGSIVLATNGKEAGNPVLFSSIHFDELNQIDGDKGAKSIVQLHKDLVRIVDIGEAAMRDFDTPEAFGN